MFLTTCQEKQKKESLFKFPYELFSEGDIVFRRGTGIVSESVLWVDKNSYYSHIGIVVKEGGIWKIVHAVPGEPDFKGDKDRVKMEEVSSFFTAKKAISGAVMRVKGDTTATRQAALLAIELFHRNILFDHEYNLTDTTKMYCTQFIDFTFHNSGIDLRNGKISYINVPGFNGEYILPSDIQQSEKLEIIYRF